MNTKSFLLVPTDFTATGDNAVHYADYLGGSFEQSSIANDKDIPVMVINSLSAKLVSMMAHRMR